MVCRPRSNNYGVPVQDDERVENWKATDERGNSYVFCAWDMDLGYGGTGVEVCEDGKAKGLKKSSCCMSDKRNARTIASNILYARFEAQS